MIQIFFVIGVPRLKTLFLSFHMIQEFFLSIHVSSFMLAPTTFPLILQKRLLICWLSWSLVPHLFIQTANSLFPVFCHESVMLRLLLRELSYSTLLLQMHFLTLFLPSKLFYPMVILFQTCLSMTNSIEVSLLLLSCVTFLHIVSLPLVFPHRPSSPAWPMFIGAPISFHTTQEIQLFGWSLMVSYIQFLPYLSFLNLTPFQQSCFDCMKYLSLFSPLTDKYHMFSMGFSQPRK